MNSHRLDIYFLYVYLFITFTIPYSFRGKPDKRMDIGANVVFIDTSYIRYNAPDRGLDNIQIDMRVVDSTVN